MTLVLFYCFGKEPNDLCAKEVYHLLELRSLLHIGYSCA